MNLTVQYRFQVKTISKQSVTQEHGTGCAVACVAFILKITYKDALKLFKNSKRAWGAGFYCGDIVDALHKGGRKFSFAAHKHLKGNASEKPDSIVFVLPSTKYALGHYFVRTFEGKWMNPWINCPNICPAQSGFESKLSGSIDYVVFPNE